MSLYVRPRQDAPSLPTYEELARSPVLMRTPFTRAELGERLGAAQEDLQVVLDFAKAAELSVVKTDAARRLVQVFGTAAQLSKAFAVELSYYQSDEEAYRGHEGPVYLPKAAADVVEGVFGLDNRRMARRASAGGFGAGLPTPPQVAQAYNFPTPTNGAKGQTVAILEFSGPTTPPLNLPTCGFSQTDVNGYITYLNDTTGSHLVSATVTSVTVDESAAAPGNVPFANADTVSDVNVSHDPDIEVALDIEVVVSVAQEANVVVYFAPNTEQGWVDAITHIVHDSSNDPSVLSISWGWPELQRWYSAAVVSGQWPFEWTQQAFTKLTNAFQSAAAIGMTVLVSSGDLGSDCGQHDGYAHVEYPASDPGVTTCGGTLVRSTSPLIQDTWNDDWGATGGGISYLADPVSWQSAANVPVSVNPDHHRGRGIPDVAGNASANSGYVLWLYGQATDTDYPNYFGPGHGGPITIEYGIGGTSAVAPLYAGLVALINASLDTRIGWLNSILYELGGTKVFNVFDDIDDGISNSVSWQNPDGTTGTSPGYTSGPGWDACTGWGSINGAQLLQAITQQATCANVIPSLEAILVSRSPKFTKSEVAQTRAWIESCAANGFLTPAQVTQADELLAEIESRQHSGGGVPHPGEAGP